MITDRRAGRIPTEEGEKRVELLKDIKIDGVETQIKRGRGLSLRAGAARRRA